MRHITPLRFAIGCERGPAGACAGARPELSRPADPGDRADARPAAWRTSSTRVFAQKVKEQSGATVIVENKTGANGVLGGGLCGEIAGRTA